MSLKEQLKVITKNAERERKEENRQRELKLVRSYEDWKIVESYLEKELKKAVARPGSLYKIGFRPGKYLKIDAAYPFGTSLVRDDNGNLIELSNGLKLTINYKDIQRFCKQHKLKLLYQFKVRGEIIVSRSCNKTLIDQYLIKV